MRVEALGVGTAAGQDLARFSQWLLSIGEGQAGERVLLPDDILMDFEEEEAMINDIFPDLAAGDTLHSAILMPLIQREPSEMQMKMFPSFWLFCDFLCSQP